MLSIQLLTYDQLMDTLDSAEHVEVIDLGAVNLHIVVQDGISRLLVENPANEELQAEVSFTA